MFDIGLSELVLILVIGLLVLGPERLPGVIRTTGLWVGRLRRSFNEIRGEIEREARIDEIKRDLHNQSIMDTLKGTAEDIDKLRELPYDVTDVLDRQRGKPGGDTQQKPSSPTTAGSPLPPPSGDTSPAAPPADRSASGDPS